MKKSVPILPRTGLGTQERVGVLVKSAGFAHYHMINHPTNQGTKTMKKILVFLLWFDIFCLIKGNMSYILNSSLHLGLCSCLFFLSKLR